jgi:serine/threonine protein phosphatase 1
MTDLVKRFPLNTEGRDFAVGDIHGCFSELQEAMFAVGFDTTRDRLFAVGDLVDRGPESDEVVDWLSRPWFHSVRGNHDQFVVDYMDGPMDTGIYLYNGGGWFLEMIPDARPYYYNEMVKLPLLIEVETKNGLVGIVHADVAGDSWEDFKKRLVDDHGLTWGSFAMWGRHRIKEFREKGFAPVISDIHKVYVGHTPVKERTEVGNVVFIDMGVCFGKGQFLLEQIN